MRQIILTLAACCLAVTTTAAPICSTTAQAIRVNQTRVLIPATTLIPSGFPVGTYPTVTYGNPAAYQGRQNYNAYSAASSDEAQLQAILKRLENDAARIRRMQSLFGVAAARLSNPAAAPAVMGDSAAYGNPVVTLAVDKKCGKCHNAGGSDVEAFALDTTSAETLREQRPAIVDAVIGGRMPPKPAKFDANELKEFLAELYNVTE